MAQVLPLVKPSNGSSNRCAILKLSMLFHSYSHPTLAHCTERKKHPPKENVYSTQFPLAKHHSAKPLKNVLPFRLPFCNHLTDSTCNSIHHATPRIRLDVAPSPTTRPMYLKLPTPIVS